MRSYHTAVRVAVLNMLVNLVLAVGKSVVGWLVHSSALLSDGAHSLTDTLSSVAVIVGIHLSAKQADAEHPYGCERMECVAAVVLAMVVAVSGVGIAVTSVRSIMSVSGTEVEAIGCAWLVAPAAVLIKEGMFRYTAWAAGRCGSAVLMADAWHQRADALSSLGCLIGMLGAKAGVSVLDPLAGLLIALWIVKAAYDIFNDAVRKMVDHACDPGLQQDMIDFVCDLSQVIGVKSMRTRLFADRVLVEMTVRISSGLTAKEAYDIAQAVRRAVEEEFADVKWCSVHIHPSEIPLAPLQNL